MNALVTMADVVFFQENAARSYRPDLETEGVGALRGALLLADAERWARATGVTFDWAIDPDSDSSSFSDDPSPWELWGVIAYDSDGYSIASLGGVDFGRDGAPFGDPYARVVAAELALEAITDADR